MGLGISSYVPLMLYLSAIALLFVGWSKPHVTMYFLVPLLPLVTVREKVMAFPLGDKLIPALLGTAMLGILFSRKSKLFGNSKLGRILIGWAILNYLSLWLGSFTLGGELPLSLGNIRVQQWINFAYMPLLFLVATAAIQTEKQMRLLLSIMCLSFVAYNLVFLRGELSMTLDHFDYAKRDAGPMGSVGVNGLAAAQAQFTAFLIGFAACMRKTSVKLAIYAIIAVGIVSLVFTFSRGGYIAILLSVFVVGLVKERKLLIVLAVFAACWSAIVPTAVVERVTMTYSSGSGLEMSAMERVMLWRDCADLITNKPIIGHGFSTYQFMHRLTTLQLVDTHNFYLKVLVEEGLIGLLVVIAFLLESVKNSWQVFRQKTSEFSNGIGLGGLSMMVAMAATNMFGDHVTYYISVTAFMWVVLALVVRQKLIFAGLKQKEDASGSAEPEAADHGPQEHEELLEASI